MAVVRHTPAVPDIPNIDCIFVILQIMDLFFFSLWCLESKSYRGMYVPLKLKKAKVADPASCSTLKW